jgi:hypothetical protein
MFPILPELLLNARRPIERVTMNAKNISKVSVGLTLTALALCGAVALSASCAGGEGGGTGGTGGGGGAGGGGGGAGGNSVACTPGTDEICFGSGKAAGVMGGYGWIALGAADKATSPKCDNTTNGGAADEEITKDKPCPESGGKTVWSSSTALCISGSIPVVTNDDYAGNWGVQIGWNASDPVGSKLDKTYSKVAFTFNAAAVTPANTAIRGQIHRTGDNAETTYCATLQSGTAVTLTAFNTKCWDGSGTSLTADDVPNIDKMGIQISSDTKNAYEIKDFCLDKVVFTP